MSPFTVFFGKGRNSRTARILLALVIPGHLIFTYFMSLFVGHPDLTIPFLCLFLVSAVFQVQREIALAQLPTIFHHLKDVPDFHNIQYYPTFPIYECPIRLQVTILLYLARCMVFWFWQRGLDTDSTSIPYLTALGDLLGVSLLTMCFYALRVIGDPNALPSSRLLPGGPANLTSDAFIDPMADTLAVTTMTPS